MLKTLLLRNISTRLQVHHKNQVYSACRHGTQAYAHIEVGDAPRSNR